MRRQADSAVTHAEIAARAARWLATGAARDFDAARARVRDELRLSSRHDLPDNLTIHRALAEYLALFQAAPLAARLQRLRRAALAALTRFASFDARLCGPVWYGTATPDTIVTLHLLSDETEAVTRFLLEQRIIYHLGEAPCRFRGPVATRRMPRFDIDYGGCPCELLVFPTRGIFHHPQSTLDHQPVRRVTAPELEALMQSGRLFADDIGAPL